jgi:hypothetical protein
LLQVEGAFWHRGGSLKSLADEILNSDCQMVHVQHENGLFLESEFLKFIITKISLHKTVDNNLSLFFNKLFSK